MRILDKAVKLYGTTHDITDTLFILPDGRLLSGNGGSEDHHSVDSLYRHDPAEHGVRHRLLTRFLRLGVIRFRHMSDALMVNFIKRPTDKQLARIREALQWAPNATLLLASWSWTGSVVGQYQGTCRPNELCMAVDEACKPSNAWRA